MLSLTVECVFLLFEGGRKDKEKMNPQETKRPELHSELEKNTEVITHMQTGLETECSLLFPKKY